MTTQPKIAVIGAGMAGLTVARQLNTVADVTVFDKSRGVGGRLATRYADEYLFDHGAQYFTAKTDDFKNFIQPLEAEGLIARWDARFVEFDGDTIVQQKQWDASYPHYVATPKMNELGKYLAVGLNVVLNTQITTLIKTQNTWQLMDNTGSTYGDFDWVVVATPSHQAAAIIPQNFQHYATVSGIQMQGCYTLMLGFDKPLVLAWDAALLKNSNLSWISVNSSKPNRGSAYTLVVHSSNQWADAYIEADKEWVQTQMLTTLTTILKQDNMQKPLHTALHRWRYANVAKQTTSPALIDVPLGMAVCGDWLVQGRVEASFTSGLLLGQKLTQIL